MRYLEGDVLDPKDDTIQQLREEIARLRHDITVVQADAAKVIRSANHGVVNLRRQLAPLYQALQQVFGELDAIGPDNQTTGGTNPRWDSWKQKLPGRPAEMIDLLLLHGEMNRNQLMAGMRAGKDVVRVTVSKLNTAGLLIKNGGRVSLKPL